MPPIPGVTAAEPPFEVICAWPVSGQYGPGSRILYYVLVAICVLARRADWLRNACLAAALLFPLLAALHGIVLAVVHVDHAVDLDIYGSFQLCAIGVLVAPVAATLSRTYFKNPGRNAIVLWSLIVVAGLISLTVEFYRVSKEPVPCTHNDAARRWNASTPFPYKDAEEICGIVCNPTQGPKSLIRGGSADNVYVVPAPHVLSFNVCIMLTTACCIPAILLVAWMMVTSSHTNWTRRWGEQSSLALKVPVQLYDAENGMPPLADLRVLAGSLNKLGVVGTQSYRLKRQSQADVSAHAAEAEAEVDHNENAVESSAASTDVEKGKTGIAGMLHELHEESALSFYDFEYGGSALQLLEIKLDADYQDFAHQLYAALRDMENEDVDLICVESVEAEGNTPIGKVMSWLKNEQDAEKDRPRKRDRKNRDSSPGVMILLGVFGLAVLAILVVGERNLFSTPVNYQTEPMANVGQWAPVAGTILVVAGSIYVLIAEGMRKERRRMRADGKQTAPGAAVAPLERLSRAFIRQLIRFNDLFDAPRWLFDHSEFQRGQQTYPLVPGEQHRNTDLSETVSRYEPPRESTDSLRSTATGRRSFTPGSVSRQQSRDRDPTPTPGPADPDATPPARKRTLTLTLPGPSETPRSRRRSTPNSPPGTPLEPIVPQDPSNPTIVVSAEEATGRAEGVDEDEDGVVR